MLSLIFLHIVGNKQEKEKRLTCPLPSPVNQTLDGGQNVIQLETAVGAAIKCFDNALGINVPRSRFLPVKTTSDLLLVMSNLYSLDAGSLNMSPKREFPTTPHVKLGSSFTKVITPAVETSEHLSLRAQPVDLTCGCDDNKKCRTFSKPLIKCWLNTSLEICYDHCDVKWDAKVGS